MTSAADERMALASELAHLVDDLVAIDLDKPDECARLGELGVEIKQAGDAVCHLAEVVG